MFTFPIIALSLKVIFQMTKKKNVPASCANNMLLFNAWYFKTMMLLPVSYWDNVKVLLGARKVTHLDVLDQ